MIDTGGIDVSAVALRRRAVAFSTNAATYVAMLVLSTIMVGAVGLFRHGLAALVLVPLGVAATWLTLRVVLRLVRGNRTAVWTALAASGCLLIVILVGLPLQAVGTLDSPALEAILSFHSGIGKEESQTFLALMVMAPTTAVVFIAADSALGRRVRPRQLRLLMLSVLSVVVFVAVTWTVVLGIRRLPGWGVAVAFIDVPMAAALVPGLVVLLTDEQRVINDVRLPAAIGPLVPKSLRRVRRGRGTPSVGWLRVAFLGLAAATVLFSFLSRIASRIRPEQWPVSLLSEVSLAVQIIAAELALGIVLALAATAVGRAARAREMPTADEVFARDQRAPVLYLRSFRDDELRVRIRMSDRRNYLENLALFLLRLVFVRMTDRFEDVLVWQLWHHGPVIAVGEPVRRPYRTGSPRLYISEEYWRAQVQELMRSARFVVVVLGRTKGLAWELQCLGRLNLTHKVVLVVPPVPGEELRARARMFDELVSGVGLPQHQPAALSTSLAAVLGPDGAWWWTFSGRHRDEWDYEVAIESAVGSIRAEPGRHLDSTDLPAADPPDARESLLRIERLRSEDSAAVQLLEIAAFLASQPVPLSWFAAAAPSLPEPLSGVSGAGLRLAATAGRISGQGLAEVADDCFQLPGPVQSALRDAMRPRDAAQRAHQARAVLSWAVGVTSDEYVEDAEGGVVGWPDIADPETWPRLAAVLPHARAVPADYREFRCRSLMLLLSSYLAERGDDRQGNLELSRALYSATEYATGLTDEERLRYMRGYGLALYLAGDAQRGLDLTRGEYEHRVARHGRDDPGALGAAINVALCLDALGRDDEAFTLGADTLARQLRVLGPDHIGTLNSAHNQAHRLQERGERGAAADMMRDVWTRRVRQHGRDHPKTAAVERCLTSMLAATGDAAAAGDDASQ